MKNGIHKLCCKVNCVLKFVMKFYRKEKAMEPNEDMYAI